MQFRRNEYALHKTGPADMEQTLTVMDFAKIDKSILLPLDLTTVSSDTLVSNQEVHKLVNLQPDRFIGFASVDPYRPMLRGDRICLKDLRLTGLKLNLSRLKLYPMDKRLTRCTSMHKVQPSNYVSCRTWLGAQCPLALQ